MFVLFLIVIILALLDKYGSSFLPSKARRQQIGGIVDTVLFVLVGIVVLGLMIGDS